MVEIRTRLVQAAAVTMLLIASLAGPAGADSAASSTPADLRQIRQDIEEIRARYRSRRWAESADLLLRIKKAFTRSAPQLLTRVSPEELSRFSYSLATLEEGLMSQDMGQLEQGFKLTKVAAHQLESRFPDDLAHELGDLQQTVEHAASMGTQGDLALAQDYLDDISAARLRLDNACGSVGRESWVHFQLATDDLGRGIRAKNPAAIRSAAAAANQDLSDLKDRVLKR